MIIGAALVVDELRKGQRLAFRYPASIPSAILNSHPALLAFHQDYLSLVLIILLRYLDLKLLYLIKYLN